MQQQSYKNHVRYYPPHHFIFYPVIILGTVTGVLHYFMTYQVIWLFIAFLFIVAGWLSYLLRQHYALTLQDRIIRQEVRFRYFTLTNQRFEVLEQQLSLSQILALRFASDLELPGLVSRAIAEKMTPDEIKKAVKDWQGDYMRV